MKYTISTGFTGKKRVKFECPKCSAPIESPLDEAGQKFPCPTCGEQFTTPGTEERQRQLKEIEAKANEAREAEARREHEAQAKASRVREQAAAEAQREAAIRAHNRAEAQRERDAAAASPQRYVYKMAQIPPNIVVEESQHHGVEAATYLEKIVNRYAREGWEFYRVDSIGVVVPPGCLSFWAAPQRDSYYVVTFRKPVDPDE